MQKTSAMTAYVFCGTLVKNILEEGISDEVFKGYVCGVESGSINNIEVQLHVLNKGNVFFF